MSFVYTKDIQISNKIFIVEIPNKTLFLGGLQWAYTTGTRNITEQSVASIILDNMLERCFLNSDFTKFFLEIFENIK